MTLDKLLFTFLLLLDSLVVFAQNAPCGSSMFLDQAALSDPAFLQQIAAQDAAARGFFQNNAMPEYNGSVVTLPVVVHLIHFNGPENLSDASVQLAVQRLNEAFANQGYYDQGSGVNVPVRFCLATRAPDGSATTGINRVVSPLTVMTLEDDDFAIKNLSRWDTKRYINIWIVRSICTQAQGCGIVGYASSPAFHGAGNDGIVLEANYFNGAPATSSPGPHEMGHYLGLYHTFEGGCTNDDCLSDGDRVCDTPPDQSTAGIPCGQTVNSCSTDTQSGLSADLPDDTKNFMDYGDVACRHDFTAGQSARMEFFTQNTRQSLLDSDGCGQPCPAIVSSDFMASNAIVALGSTVTFSNQSQNAASFIWTLDGTPFSTLANPAFTFNNTGAYTVTLTSISADPGLCPSQSSTSIIQVICPVSADFQVNSIEVFTGGTVALTNTSQGAGQFQWFVNDLPQGPALASYTFDMAGAYEIRLEASNGQCSTSKTLVVTVQDSCKGSSFQKYYGTGNDERGVASIVLADGNFLVGGDGVVPGALQEVLLIKTDPDGNVIWSKRFGTPAGSESLQHLAAQADGGFVALLSSNTWASYNDATVAGFDNDGQLLWQKRLITPGADELRRIVATPDGGWIACGYVQPAPPQKASACFLKLDAAGNQQWISTYGMPNADCYATDIAVAEDSSFRACGYFILSGTRDALMFELDKDGNMTLAQTVGYQIADRALWSVDVRPNFLGPNIYFAGEETTNIGDEPMGLFINKAPGGNTITGNAYQLQGQGLVFYDVKNIADNKITIAVGLPASQPQPKAILFNLDLSTDYSVVQQYAGKGQASVAYVENTPEAGALYTGRSSDGGQQDIFFMRANSIGVAGVCPQEKVYLDNLSFPPNNVNQTVTLNSTQAFPVETVQDMSVSGYALSAGEPCAPSCLIPPCKTAWTEYFEDVNSLTVLSAVIEAPDGTFYAGGWRNNQTLLVNFSPDGSVLWSRQFHCSERNDRLQDLMLDSDGNIVGVGNIETATLVFNGYAFKYNPVTGVLIWVREESQNKRSRFTSIQELGPGGNYLIGGAYPTGTSSGDPDFDPVLLEVARNTGDLLTNNWNQSFDLDKNEELRSVRRKGNLMYAVGKSETPPPGSLRKPVIYKTDLNGNPVDLWRIVVPSAIGEPSLEAADIAFDGDSMVIALQGRFDTAASLLTKQLALVKVAPNGQVLWLHRYTIDDLNAVTVNNIVQSLIAGDDGYYVLTREFLFKTDKNGKFSWIRHTYGRHEAGRNLVAEQGNAVFLVGKNTAPGGLFIARYLASNGDAGAFCGQDFGISVTEETLTDATVEPFSWNQYASPLLLQTNAASPAPVDLG
ncbi:MAG TPA: M43 family zinc metalloprotease, partial [Saprospiraceae bacterium]|nr:M43 family zinc metalloprotease [Saprospiraceae bacterium]